MVAGEAKDQQKREEAVVVAAYLSSESSSGNDASGIARNGDRPWAKTANVNNGGSVGSDLISAPSASLLSS